MVWGDIVRKLTSRKFWAAVISFVLAFMTYKGTDSGTAENIVALIWAGASLLAYIVGEGLVDAAGAAAGVGGIEVVVESAKAEDAGGEK